MEVKTDSYSRPEGAGITVNEKREGGERGKAVPWTVWAKGGISSNFVRAVLSNDHLCVRDEVGRYHAGREVLE